MTKNIAAILAGGKGTRLCSDLPKQFIEIAGKTLLEHTVSLFQNHPLIDEIVITGDPAYFSRIEESVKKMNFFKVKHLLSGGKERYHSTLSVLDAYEDQSCNLLIHDAVRPLVTERIITEVIENLKTYRAVNVAVPVTDTIIETDASQNCITRIPERNCLFQVQTPQGFYRETLRAGFEKALKDPDFKTTDDCSVVHQYLPEEKIRIVKGDPANMKVTWASDLSLVENLLLHRS